ncbi:MAG: cyclase/dehydrase, partial [Chloroflexi bacterium]|nr:cyclase/dehydrase [Chloroflexota bacterium]
MDVKKAITVNRPPDELYQFWHDFENLPRFMDHLKAVQVRGE